MLTPCHSTHMINWLLVHVNHTTNPSHYCYSSEDIHSLQLQDDTISPVLKAKLDCGTPPRQTDQYSHHT